MKIPLRFTINTLACAYRFLPLLAAVFAMTDPLQAAPEPQYQRDPSRVQFQKEVDLRPVYIEKRLLPKDQGRRPSCSVFAVVSAYEYERARRQGNAQRLSEEFLIWATLEVQPGIPLDTGFNFQEVLTALQTYGVPPYELMPNTYGKPVDQIKPDRRAFEAARANRAVIPVWFRPNDPHIVHRLVDALNNGTPVIIAVKWPHWKTLEHFNVLAAQKPIEGSGHAVTLIGYRNETGRPEDTTFIFRNSWGMKWGVGGCGFIRAAYLQEHLLAAFRLSLP